MDKIKAAITIIRQNGQCSRPEFIECIDCLINHKFCSSNDHDNPLRAVKLKKILSEKYTVGEIAEAIL